MWHCWYSCRREVYRKNLTILRVAWLSHTRYHDVLLWNDVIVDWSNVHTWFGTCSAPGARIPARGLVYPMFVSTWFGMSL